MSESTSKNTNKYISLQEASDYSPYSQEYLSLLARKGKIKAKKIGRNWFITRENLESYLKKQSVLISLPKNIFNQQSQDTAVARLASSAPLTPEEEEGQSSGARHAGHSKLFEEFERLNPGIFQSQQPQNVNASLPQQAPISNQPTSPQQRTYTQPVTVQNIQAPTQDSHNIQDEKVMSKLDKLSDSLTNFADKIADVLPKVVDAAKSEPLPQVQTERIIERIIEKSDLTADQKEFIEIQKQSVGYKVKKLNYFSRNSVTNPNKMMAVMLTAIVAIFLAVGGFSFGRIDELALAVKEAFTDSETLGGHFPGTHANEVLLLDKSGNVSIFGHIETEGQLRSRAPEGVAPIVVDSMTKIDNLNADYLDDLSAKDFTLAYVTKNGNITYEDVFLEGNVEIGKSLTIKGAMNMTDSLNVYGQLGVFSNAVFGKDVKLTGGDLIIEKGTIKINNTKLVNNLNAELLNGMRSSDMTLDFVTDNGASTTNTISVGGLNVSGPLAVSQLNVSGSGFFDGSVWSRAGSFQTLGVARSVSLGDKNNSGNSTVEIYSKNFSVDAGGNVGIGGNLVLSGNINSNLIASGSYDLGSSSKRWNTVYGTTGNFLNLTASGSLNFGDTLYVNTASRSVGIGTSQPETDFEIVGVTSASYLLINNTFSVGTGATSSFNVIGLGTPTSPLINSSDDLYVGGNLEVGGAIIGTLTMTSSSVSGNFEVSGITEIADGTAANPSLTFNDDMDTGLFRIGSNIMGITTGGVERLRITDNGASLSGNFDLAGDARLDRDLTVVGNTFLSSASVSDTLEATNLKADSIVSSTGNLNIGAFTLGGNVTGANYNIVGINKFDATSASISTNMEISGYASVGGNVYIGGNETLTGTFSGLSTGSNSFLGSLNVTKSLTAAGINGTGLNINGNGSFTGNSTFTLGDNGDTGSINTSDWDISTSGALTGISGISNDGAYTQSGTGINTLTGQLNILSASASGTIEATSLISNNILQVNGSSILGYNRFGVGTTTHSLSSANDVLISGKLEVDGDIFVDGTLYAGAISYNSASVSGNFEVGGTLQLADGSAANPSATFTNDLDTGLFRIGSNNLGFTTGGVQRLNISDNGASISVPFEASSIKLTTLGSDSTITINPTGGNTFITGYASVSQGFESSYLNTNNISNSTGVLTINAFTLGGSITGASYNLTGLNQLTSAIASISTNFEVGNYASIGGNLAVKGNETLTGTFSGLSTGSNSFLGSLNVTKSLTAAGITGTGLNINGNGSFTGNVGIGTNLTVTGQTSLTTASASATIEAITFKGTTYSGDGAITFGNASALTTVTGSSLTISPTAWTATPTISGLITATSGLTANGALTANSTFTLGDNGDTGSINTSDWDISTSGALTGISGISNDGAYTQSGTGINTLTGQLNILSASASGTIEATSLISNNILQVNGSSILGYNRFGVGTTTHSLSSANDVLISGKLEVDGDIFVDGTLYAGAISYNSASVSGNFEVGGTLQLADGSAANPSATFTNDLDTGLFRIGSNNLGFTTGGVQRLNISDNGASISGNFDPSTDNIYDLGDSSYRFRTGYFGTSLGINSGNTLNNTLEVGGTASISGNAYFGGNVGIGTTVAGAKLEINNIVGSQILRFDHPQVGLSHNDSLGEIQFYGRDDSSTTRRGVYGSISSIATDPASLTINQDVNEGGALVFKTANDAIGSTNLVLDERMRITSLGNVGIGTTNPGALLQIGNVFTFRNDGQMKWGTTANYGIASWDTGKAVIGGQAGMDLGLYADGSQKVVITTTGNVGIGTTNPGSQLYIYGSSANMAVDNSSTSSLSSILLKENGALTGGLIAYGSAHATLANQLWIKTYSASAPIIFATNSTEWMRVAGNGNVGIGTTAPVTHLQIGTGTLNYANGTGDVYIQNDLEVDGTIYGAISGTIDLNFTQGSVLFAGSGGVIAQDNANFFWDDTNNGLGIGTTNAQGYKLNVEGTARLGASTLSVNGDSVMAEAPTTNYIVNDYEDLATGVGSDSPGALKTISTDYAYYGAKSLKWVYGGTGSNNIYNTATGAPSSTTFTVTMYVRKADGGVVSGLSMYIYIGANTGSVTPTITSVGNGWYKVVGTRTVAVSGALGLTGLSGLDSTQANYFDGWQAEVGATGTSYVYGTRAYGDAVVGGKLEVLGSGESMIYGNLGIGTTNPDSQLHVAGAGILTLGNTGVTHGAINSAGSLFINIDTNNDATEAFEIASHRTGQSGGTSLLKVLDTGNIGIGTTMPYSKFDVITPANSYVSVGSAALSVGQYAGIHFGYREPNTNYRKSAIVFERTDNAGGGANAAGRVHILNGPATGAGSATLVDAKLTIGELGNVGIGTTAPGYRLDIKSSGTSVDVLAITQSSSVNPIFKVRELSGGQGGLYVFNAANTATNLINGNGDSYLNAGNVGIGTTAPTNKLQVAGTIEATSLISNNILQVNGSSTVGYNRFGVGTTSHSLSSANDVLISGKLEVDGTLQLADGSAANPSATFTNDLDTGLFRIGSNNLGFTTGGVQRLNISDNGASISVPFEA